MTVNVHSTNHVIVNYIKNAIFPLLSNSLRDDLANGFNYALNAPQSAQTWY